MGRPLRNFEPGEIYLVCHVGNKNLAVYLDVEDHEFGLRLLRIASQRYQVSVLAYSHVYTQGMWVFRPSTRDGISNLMRDMQGGYSRYLNRKYKHRHWLASDDPGPRAGQCAGVIERSVNWPGRYRCFRITGDLLEPITHVVEQSPVRLGRCGDAVTYDWSSAPARIGGRCVRKIVQLIRRDIPAERWAAVLRATPSPAILMLLEASLRSGRSWFTVPCGTLPYLNSTVGGAPPGYAPQ